MTTSLKLAITKIGDLLLDNMITQDSMDKPIKDISLIIPNYQRPYKWTVKNVIQLLDDIIDSKNANKEKYRVGTLILHQVQSKEKSLYNIVDGQQRIITFSLLLKAIDNNFVIDFLEQSLTDNPYNTRNIPNNFLTLERRVNKFSDNREKEELKEYIKSNCELIVVITDDISEAFQFFDSQNARGKKLYPHDLLKAYHLREMNELDISETEKIVKGWEDLDQKELSSLFSDYLYRVKEWTKGNKAWELTEHNIHKFKGITRQDNFPYAQFYKGAFSYTEMINHSSMPFVSGIGELKPFQLDTPIVAGKPFFDYAKHYYVILKDIQNNDKYEGHFINDNEIVKTLDLKTYKSGVGNRITRLIFDTAILLYIDRFCPQHPDKIDLEMLEQFVVFAFIWAYSLRAQYSNLGWQSAQNYIMGNDIKNSLNIYKTITESDSPISLLSTISEKINSLSFNDIKAKKDNLDEQRYDGVYVNYLHYFKQHKFL
nr:DUF262 domain-containing protein [uncultured Tolumonas sp.]